jgi:hypothetical protein
MTELADGFSPLGCCLAVRKNSSTKAKSPNLHNCMARVRLEVLLSGGREAFLREKHLIN